MSGSLAATSKLDRGLHESFLDSKMQFVVKIDPLKLCCESWVNMGLHNFQAEIKMPLTGYIRKTSRHKLKTHKHCKCNWGKMENAAGHPSNWLVYTVTYRTGLYAMEIHHLQYEMLALETYSMGDASKMLGIFAWLC